jgi:hypothetical protein
MRNRKSKVFIVCEDHEYSGNNKVIGLFPTREEAESSIRAKGEVLCWKAEYFMPFALVWAQMRTTHKDYGPLTTWCWIEVHEVELPVEEPKFYKEVIAMICACGLVLMGGAIPGHHIVSTALVLIGCIASLIAFGRAFLKA